MMDRYTKLQMVGIYAAMAVFLIFILLPFFEMFMAAPLSCAIAKRKPSSQDHAVATFHPRTGMISPWRSAIFIFKQDGS